jgi:hypothetical protein
MKKLSIEKIRTKIYQLLYIQYLLMMSKKKYSKHVEAINWQNTHKNIPIAVHRVPPDDEQRSTRNM